MTRERFLGALYGVSKRLGRRRPSCRESRFLPAHLRVVVGWASNGVRGTVLRIVTAPSIHEESAPPALGSAPGGSVKPALGWRHGSGCRLLSINFAGLCTVHPLRAYIMPLSPPPQGGRSIATMPADVAHPARTGTGQVPRGARTASYQRCCSSFPPDGEGTE